VIKRYANRKLYNTNDSCYITLNEIAQMVKTGVDVKIIDYKSKKDITSVTLAQIIFEKEKRQKLLPSQTLRDIIQTGGTAITDFLSKHVNLGQLKEEAEKTVEVVERLINKATFTREDGASLIREIIKQSQTNLEDLQRRIDERIRAVVGPVANLHLLHKELEALKAQVDFLEEKIVSLETSGGAPSDGGTNEPPETL